MVIIAIGPSRIFLFCRVGCTGSSEDSESVLEGGPDRILTPKGPKPYGVGFEWGSVVDSEGVVFPTSCVFTSASLIN